MNKSEWGSGRSCVLDSGFWKALTVSELRKKGSCSTTFIKKKRSGPKRKKAQEMTSETQENEVGTIRARKGASDNNSSANNFSLVVLADSKHASMILTK